MGSIPQKLTVWHFCIQDGLARTFFAIGLMTCDCQMDSSCKIALFVPQDCMAEGAVAVSPFAGCQGSHPTWCTQPVGGGGSRNSNPLGLVGTPVRACMFWWEKVGELKECGEQNHKNSNLGVLEPKSFVAPRATMGDPLQHG